jgi:tetratricopeptide (TPR) repeat protein
MTIKKSLKRLAAVSTEIPRIHFREGLQSGFMDDYESAIQSFDRINYITYGSSYFSEQAQLYKANAFVQLEQFDKAVTEFKKYLENNVKDSFAWLNLGASYIELEEFGEDTLSCFKRSIAIELEQKNPDEEILKAGLSNEATVFLHRIENNKKTISKLENDKNHNPEMYDSRIHDVCLNAQNQYVELLKSCISKLRDIDRDDSDALSLKTELLWIQEKNDDAIENIKKCCKLYPDDWEFWSDLSTGYLLVNNYHECLKCIENALKIKPNEDLLWYNKACILSKMNEIDDSLDALLVAISIQPENLVLLTEESDFDNIKNSERFKKFLTIPV